jgi:hypothetical protein
LERCFVAIFRRGKRGKPPEGVDVTRRAALVSAAALLTAACGDRESGRMLQLAHGQIFGEPLENPMTREQIEAVPYALLEMRIGRTALANLVLIQRKGQVLQWRTQDLKFVETRSGRLVKTAGLPKNVVNTQFPDGDPVARGLHTLQGPAESLRVVDFDSPDRYGRVIRSRIEILGVQPIAIKDLTYQTWAAREENAEDQTRWKFENLYWFDPNNGFVWRSQQHFDPELPPMVISILKPPAANV